MTAMILGAHTGRKQGYPHPSGWMPHLPMGGSPTSHDAASARVARHLMRTLSPDEARAFLAEGARTAKVATTMANGGPHVVPVWFVLDAGDLVFTIAGDSVKARNLARDPRAAVCVDDETFPYAFATVRGPVEFAERPHDFLAWTTRIAERYVGPERATEYGERDAALDDWVVRLKPERILAQAEIAV
jgi:PPOX class probable F420-dependent enzyme